MIRAPVLFYPETAIAGGHSAWMKSIYQNLTEEAGHDSIHVLDKANSWHSEKPAESIF